MADTAIQPTSAILELQERMQQRVRLMQGGISGFTFNDVQALVSVFTSPQAAFDYAFNLVLAGPREHPQLALAVARAITEDYQTATLGGKAYLRLDEITALDIEQRPAGSDDFMFDACFQLRRAVEADLYTTSTSRPDWAEAGQRSAPVLSFLINYIHKHFPAYNGAPYLQNHATTLPERIGHLRFVHHCWEQKPDMWGHEFCRLLLRESLAAEHDENPFNRNRSLLGQMLHTAQTEAPYHLADAMLDNSSLFPSDRRIPLLAQMLHNVFPLLRASAFEDMNKLGLKVDALVRPYREATRETQLRHRRYRGPLRGIFRVGDDINSYLMQQHAAKRGDAPAPAFALEAAQVTLDAAPVATSYGPRIVPQHEPLSPLQQDALRVKATRHRAELQNRHGLRRAMARFKELEHN